MNIYIVVYSHLIYLKVKVMYVHLQEKSLLELGDPKLAEVEANIKYYQGYVRDWEKVVNRQQTELNKLMSEKNKDEG